MVRGEGTTVAKGVTPDEAFDFVLDPAQYTKADTKMVWVTKLADTPDGMLAREDGKFLGRLPGSVVTRYRWERPQTDRRHARTRRAPESPRLVRDRGRGRRDQDPSCRGARSRARPTRLAARPGGPPGGSPARWTPRWREIGRLLEAGERGSRCCGWLRVRLSDSLVTSPAVSGPAEVKDRSFGSVGPRRVSLHSWHTTVGGNDLLDVLARLQDTHPLSPISSLCGVNPT